MFFKNVLENEYVNDVCSQMQIESHVGCVGRLKHMFGDWQQTRSLIFFLINISQIGQPSAEINNKK